MDRKDVKIGTPCTLDWRKMTPAAGGRFCGDCKKVVRDLSSMTEREARALMKREGGGELCVRYVYDNQGRVFFGADAPRPDVLLSASLLSRARRAAAAAAVVALPFATQGCAAITEPLGITSQEQQVEPEPEYHEMMGGIGMDPDRDVPQPDTADASADASEADAGESDADDSDAAPGDQDGGAAPDAEPIN